ncbi:MAG TPA: hypothetical protein DDX47_01625 [Candidatus Jacksonbacteria bacterium]|nr:hypothetical protein [Candidatus Jacksonbacteria bacterium]
MKKTLLLPIIIIALVAFAFILYSTGKLPWFNKDLSSCLRLKVGDVVAEVRYPDEFIYSNDPYAIYLSKKSEMNQDKQSSFLIISAENYESVENVIRFSLVEPGPKYKKSTFNGYDAAWDQQSEDNSADVYNYYRIPFGNRIIGVDYYFSNSFSKNEKNKAEKMLKSVTLTQVKEDVAKAVVENCGK